MFITTEVFEIIKEAVKLLDKDVAFTVINPQINGYKIGDELRVEFNNK